MLCTCHDAPYLGTHHQKTALAAWSIIATLLALCDAWREALAAHRQYEHLRSRGVSHDAAIRESLCLGRLPRAGIRHAAKLLYLAGKA
jgi:hypothetical protein